ncbi:MAG: hypothetical protein HPM95_16690 [Alphaproteobacteria bacterium]|nr:hypothetical protein [Alphaproteobacteria bacterium]
MCQAFREGEGQLESLRVPNLALNPGETGRAVNVEPAQVILHIADLRTGRSGELLVSRARCLRGLAVPNEPACAEMQPGVRHEFHPPFAEFANLMMPRLIRGLKQIPSARIAANQLTRLHAARPQGRSAAIGASGGEQQRGCDRACR